MITHLTAPKSYQDEDKFTKILSQKARTVNEIVTFLKWRGCRATGNTCTAKHKGREAYADIIATIAGQPVEVLVGVRRLSQKQRDYRRAVQSAGMVYLVVADAEGFREWYSATTTFKSTAP